MKGLVESLVSGVTVTAQKEIVRNVAWTVTRSQIYYEMITTRDDGETNINYAQKVAEINISGINNQITSVVSLDPRLTVQFIRQTSSGTDIRAVVNCQVPESYSLLTTGRQPDLDTSYIIQASDWDKKDTYKFFN